MITRERSFRIQERKINCAQSTTRSYHSYSEAETKTGGRQRRRKQEKQEESSVGMAFRHPELRQLRRCFPGAPHEWPTSSSIQIRIEAVTGRITKHITKGASKEGLTSQWTQEAAQGLCIRHRVQPSSSDESLCQSFTDRRVHAPSQVRCRRQVVSGVKRLPPPHAISLTPTWLYL